MRVGSNLLLPFREQLNLRQTWRGMRKQARGCTPSLRPAEQKKEKKTQKEKEKQKEKDKEKEKEN